MLIGATEFDLLLEGWDDDLGAPGGDPVTVALCDVVRITIRELRPDSTQRLIQAEQSVEVGSQNTPLPLESWITGWPHVDPRLNGAGRTSTRWPPGGRADSELRWCPLVGA